MNARSQSDFFHSNEKKLSSTSNESAYSRPLVELGDDQLVILYYFKVLPQCYKTLYVGAWFMFYYNLNSLSLGPSETTLSLAWFSREPKTLVTGMNNKFLRIFDLRGKLLLLHSISLIHQYDYSI